MRQIDDSTLYIDKDTVSVGGAMQERAATPTEIIERKREKIEGQIGVLLTEFCKETGAKIQNVAAYEEWCPNQTKRMGVCIFLLGA